MVCFYHIFNNIFSIVYCKHNWKLLNSSTTPWSVASTSTIRPTLSVTSQYTAYIVTTLHSPVYCEHRMVNAGLVRRMNHVSAECMSTALAASSGGTAVLKCEHCALWAPTVVCTKWKHCVWGQFCTGSAVALLVNHWYHWYHWTTLSSMLWPVCTAQSRPFSLHIWGPINWCVCFNRQVFSIFLYPIHTFINGSFENIGLLSVETQTPGVDDH